MIATSCEKGFCVCGTSAKHSPQRMICASIVIEPANGSHGIKNVISHRGFVATREEQDDWQRAETRRFVSAVKATRTLPRSVHPSTERESSTCSHARQMVFENEENSRRRKSTVHNSFINSPVNDVTRACIVCSSVF